MSGAAPATHSVAISAAMGSRAGPQGHDDDDSGAGMRVPGAAALLVPAAPDAAHAAPLPGHARAPGSQAGWPGQPGTVPGVQPMKVRGISMNVLNLTDARCEALFASELQRSDDPTAKAISKAIRCTVRRLGVRGCAARLAEEYGEHPETAAERMRWVRQLVVDAAAPRPAGPTAVRSLAEARHPAGGRQRPACR